uniref:Uncharacterized protein n=1 Tax=Podarcis muralis TaxID=64176 RepID=A0A670J669_PODMU
PSLPCPPPPIPGWGPQPRKAAALPTAAQRYNARLLQAGYERNSDVLRTCLFCTWAPGARPHARSARLYPARWAGC